MTSGEVKAGMLAGYRILDLTDEQGFLCGKIMGDLGADVIKVERPGGDPARRIAPFYHDIPHPEKSLYWFAFNSSKRGITLNIETADGKAIFRTLASKADAVIESFTPGYLAGLGLDYTVLSKLNPRLVVTSITPFGQTGPHANYKGPDIVVTAMSGFMYVCGDPDRAPVRISFPQSYQHAGSDAAAGTIAALFCRGNIGEGQHVDVSMQESLIWNMMAGNFLWEAGKVNPQRMGPDQQINPHVGRRMNWPCQDGYIAWSIFTGPAYAAGARALVAWMDEEGAAPDFLKQVDFTRLNMQKMTRQEFLRLEEPIGKFLLKHTKAEIFREALKRRIILLPMHTMKEVLADPQLMARDFWQQVPHPELGAVITYPGSFARSSGTAIEIRRRAPLIGEHNEEVYINETGFSAEQLAFWKRAMVI